MVALYFPNVINIYINIDLIYIYDVLLSLQNQNTAHPCLSAQMLNWELPNEKQECQPRNNDFRLGVERTSLIFVCSPLQADKSHFVNLSY